MARRMSTLFSNLVSSLTRTSYHQRYTQRVCPCRDNGICTTKFGSFVQNRIETSHVLFHLILDRSADRTPPNVKSVPLPLHHRPRCHLLHLHLRGSVYAEFAGQWDMTRGTVPRIELSQPFKPFFFSSSKNCQQTKEFAVYNRRGAYI